MAEDEEQGKHPGGRPPIEIDPHQVEELARIGCTEEDMAKVLGVSVDTIQRRKRESEEFRGVIEKGQASLRNSLRRLQVKKALEGNTTMLIWLGKQLLGQRDRQDLHHGQDPESDPVQIRFIDLPGSKSVAGSAKPERATPAMPALPQPAPAGAAEEASPSDEADPHEPAWQRANRERFEAKRRARRPAPSWDESDFARTPDGTGGAG